MSIFICAHGELISKCPYCNEFDGTRPNDDLKEDEQKDLFFQIVRSIKKEEVDY